MIPIALDPSALSLAVIGRGAPAWHRFQALRAAGAACVTLFCDSLPEESGDWPAVDLTTAAKTHLVRTLPEPRQIGHFRVVWLAGLTLAEIRPFVAAARASYTLVNVEDQPAFCDFHSVAELRRGDLLLTVSTGGQAPGLASAIARLLERRFGPEWVGRVGEVARARSTWRAKGLGMAEVARRTERLAQVRGWLG